MQLEELLPKIHSNDLVLIIFYAKWFTPSSDFLKEIQEIVNQDLLPIISYPLDVDQSIEITEKYKIRSVPTILLFLRGEILLRTEGLNSTFELNNYVLKASSK